MKSDLKSMQTQIIKRPLHSDAYAPAGVLTIMRMIDVGEEPHRIYKAIAKAACGCAGIEAAAVFIADDTFDNHQTLAGQWGGYAFKARPIPENGACSDKGAFHPQSSGKTSRGEIVYYDIICLSAPVGSLAVYAPKGVSPDSSDKLFTFAHHCSVVFERQRLCRRLQHFVERLEVLNELNQLIASNVGVERIARSLARESAYRFGADLALTFLLDSEGQTLLAAGGYGCQPHQLPEAFPTDSGILAQTLQVGGHLSIPNLRNYNSHGLPEIEELGICSVEVCAIQTKGETLGAVLIGYKNENKLSGDELIRFEEVCQGGAVAINNAHTQERINAYTERLEELVESRTKDLAVQTEIAEEANRAKSRFLANMSHELRTPLTAIVGYASVLGDGVFGDINKKQGDALNAIERSSEHLKELIDDVLNLARIESGKETADPRSVNLKHMLTQVHKLMLQSAISKGITLEPLKIAPDLEDVSVYADKRHFHQILINIMSNAVKYTPKNGRVWIDAELTVDKVKISISDTGVGIPKEKIGKLFERFERGCDEYSEKQEGTGIGLNLTRQLVELNGGRIGVESEVNKGSTFWVMLPTVSSDSVVIDLKEQESEKIRLDGLTAVVVDDNRDTCEVLKQILTSVGASVKVAYNVKEGLEKIRNNPPDILLADLAIPGESGLDLIKKVKSSENWAGIPIVVLSACAFPEDREKALESGAALFIPKPFRPVEVIRAARELTLRTAAANNPAQEKIQP